MSYGKTQIFPPISWKNSSHCKLRDPVRASQAMIVGLLRRAEGMPEWTTHQSVLFPFIKMAFQVVSEQSCVLSRSLKSPQKVCIACG